MTLLAPYWLFAASAILIPIAIHLWNKRQGKTVKVGSIRWLEASASKQWSRIRLTDAWLLLLRCVILILLAVALANPVMQVSPAATKGHKAIYISPELFYSEAITELKSIIDPMLQQGYQLHTFTPEFNTVSVDEWQLLSTNPIDSTVENGNHWQLLRALAEKHTQAQDSVLLFTSDQQRHFTGTPALLQKNITWVPVALNTTKNWVQASYLTKNDSIVLMIGQSSREGTAYRQHKLSLKQGAGTIASLPIRTTQEGDSLWVHWGNKIDQKTLLKQEPLKFSFLTHKAQQEELKYLEAAVTAISHYTGIPVELNKTATTQKPDWLFWLSDAAIPDSVLQLVDQGMHLWKQQGSAPKATNANLITSHEPITLYQLSEASAAYEQIVWAASNGEPLLTSQTHGKGIIYHFRSRFSPGWSRLGQSSQLPEMLLPFVLPGVRMTKYDARALPEVLLKPAKKAIPLKAAKEEKEQSLLRWFVLLASVLFLLERFISGKRLKA